MKTDRRSSGYRPVGLVAGGVLTAAMGIQLLASAAPEGQPAPFHPVFPLLDSAEAPVLESGEPVSTMTTCGGCHDTAYIAEHDIHGRAGLPQVPAGQAPSGRPWDTSAGLFGQWDPLLYRYLTPAGDDPFDLGVAEWLQTYGARHVGGGPALADAEGTPLDRLVARGAMGPETYVLDPTTGRPTPWNWDESGTIELNCFLCHLSKPNEAARLEALDRGDFGWANTATLIGSGVVEWDGEAYSWMASAFTPDGTLNDGLLEIQDPANENCGLCHGLVHDDVTQPLVIASCDPDVRRTVTTGQIVSPERIADSGMNLAAKDSLDLAWDVHAERRLECTDCHASANNPVYFQEADETRPAHITFDPRRLELGEYLYQPSHELASGSSGTMRSCESCHDLQTTHAWLPYKDRHTAALACETCHVPRLYANAMRQLDWTSPQADGGGQTECRGVDLQVGDMPLVTGYEPVWLADSPAGAGGRLAPYNLITTWYWVHDNPPRPVRWIDLEAAWFSGDGYAAEIVLAFDPSGDGSLDFVEARLDAPAKVDLIAARLEALGLENPRIAGEILPYAIHHDINTDEWAVRDCQECHSDSSRLGQPFVLASYVPGGVVPDGLDGTDGLLDGSIETDAAGQLVYWPSTNADHLYVLGRDRLVWVDRAGGYLFVLVLAGIAVHGGLRFFLAFKRPHPIPRTEPAYLYGVYERLWHWLQTFSIVLLLLTGLVIHRPDTFGLFSFRGVVLVHNILGAILVVNAGLSLFYHLASGDIRQFLPRPAGFFDQAIQQAVYYVRGIFRREPHPFLKDRRRKLNPLQQATYLAILNLLLPLQVVTGILMWGAQRWPDVAASLGGLTVLAPLHTAVAWLLASFIVGHVYLTTTGATAFSSVRGMMFGWEEIEAQSAPIEGGTA